MKVALEDMIKKIEQNARYHNQRFQIRMHLPRLFSKQRAKREKRRKTMLKLDRKIKNRDFTMLLPFAIVSSMIEKHGKTRNGLIGLKPGKW